MANNQRRLLDQRRGALASLAADTLYVGIYCRVSTEQQAAPEKTSIDMQAAACHIRAEEMAKRENKRLVIVETWKDEGVSGTVAADQRPELSKALQYARAGRLHVLLSFTDDRYARLMVHGVNLVDALEKVGVRYAVCDAEYLYDAQGKMLPESRLMQVMKQYFAEVERKRILQKTVDGMRGLAKKGKAPIRGRFPIGYIIRQKWEAQAGRCTQDEVGTYEIVPEQAEVVRGIYERMAGGASLRAIVRWLQDDLCLPTYSGGKSWSPPTIHRIITDPLYKGVGSYGKTLTRHDESRRDDGLNERYLVPADPADIITFPVPAIVSAQLWQKANDQMKRNQAMQSGVPEQRYLLSGFLRCPECGGSMCGHQGSGPTHARYYQCIQRQADRLRAKHDDTPKCTGPFVRGEEIEAVVGKALAETVLRQKCLSSAMQRFQTDLRAAHHAGGDGLTERRESLRKQWEAADKAHHAAQTAIERILLLDPEADLSRFVTAQKTHRERRDAVAVQIAELETVAAHPTTERLLSADANALAAYVCGMLSCLPEMLESPVLSPSEKRFILDGAVAKIVPVNETPHKQRYRKWGVEIELRQNLLADAIASETESVPAGILVQGAGLLPIPGFIFLEPMPG